MQACAPRALNEHRLRTTADDTSFVRGAVVDCDDLLFEVFRVAWVQKRESDCHVVCAGLSASRLDSRLVLFYLPMICSRKTAR